MTKTFMIPAHGRRFKVVSEKTGALMGQYDTLEDAQAQADEMCNDAKRTGHYLVYEVVFCGGSKTLADIDRKTA